MEAQVHKNKCNKIREINAVLLELFEKDLTAQGLSERTTRRHMFNADIYINDFLLGTIRTAAASIKKFYQCMLEHGKIEKEDYDHLCWEINDEMELWQEECAAFNVCEEE